MSLFSFFRNKTNTFINYLKKFYVNVKNTVKQVKFSVLLIVPS
jgi:hypothetical protein